MRWEIHSGSRRTHRARRRRLRGAEIFARLARMARPTVLLFDIDGTLVSTGGAGRRAMERAFRAHLGARADADFAFAGMTDPAIVRIAAERAGRTADRTLVAAVLATYLEALEEEVVRTETFKVFAGVLELVARALTWSGFAVGLGTGNVEQGAKIKLGRANLSDSFAFGGFGSDHEDRGELIRVGAERGAARLGTTMEACRVVVIGDTPRDVDAARAIGATCVGVGTGPFTREALSAHGADFAFDDLSSEAAWRAVRGDDDVE